MVAIFGLFVFSRAAVVWNTIISRTDQPVSVAAHYYEAIRNQDYASAYADLDSHAALDGQPVDKQAFINRAKAADTQRGVLLTYGLLRQPGDGAQFNASLRRGDQAYTVHLQLLASARMTAPDTAGASRLPARATGCSWYTNYTACCKPRTFLVPT